MSAWQEAIKLAEQHGFIVQAAGGVAVLAAREVQKTSYGDDEYYRIQRMNGHCPLKWGEEKTCSEVSHVGRHCEECSLANQRSLFDGRSETEEDAT